VTQPLTHAEVRPKALFGTVVIAGVGLIGGSVGLGTRQRFLAEHVIGFDFDPKSLEAARGMGVIDEAQLHPGRWLKEAELVVLASPARTLVASARLLAAFTPADTIFTDVGSIKSAVCRELTDLRFVGGHPMAGSERVGVLHADAGLLENAVWVITPDATTDAEALARVRAFVEQLGATPLETTPEQHDRLVAAVSHLPYLSAVALTELVARDGDRDLMMLLAAGGFRDLTRVASGSPRMSRDMVVGNKAPLRDALASFRRYLDELEALLDDPEASRVRLAASTRASIASGSSRIASSSSR